MNRSICLEHSEHYIKGCALLENNKYIDALEEFKQDLMTIESMDKVYAIYEKEVHKAHFADLLTILGKLQEEYESKKDDLSKSLLNVVYNNIGFVYDHSIGQPSRHSSFAITYYVLASNNGFAISMANLGYLYKKHTDYNNAIKYLTMAAKNGRYQVYIDLGDLYLTVKDKHDLDLATHYYLCALDYNVKYAENRLGHLYLNYAKNYTKAIKYLLLAHDKDVNDIDIVKNLVYAYEHVDVYQAITGYLTAVRMISKDKSMQEQLLFEYCNKLMPSSPLVAKGFCDYMIASSGRKDDLDKANKTIVEQNTEIERLKQQITSTDTKLNELQAKLSVLDVKINDYNNENKTTKSTELNGGFVDLSQTV